VAKIKHTKNELKAQREALQRYERFLPMLQLKKQQLQVEIQAITAKIAALDEETAAIERTFTKWIPLLAEPAGLEELVAVDRIETEQGNIAGVAIPIFKRLHLEQQEPDLFLTPSWVDDAMDTLEELISLRVRREILEEQRRRIAEELRTTSQRVNLFEKVKIPACREHIRIIKIFLGDEQTAAVARGKIAKRRAA